MCRSVTDARAGVRQLVGVELDLGSGFSSGPSSFCLFFFLVFLGGSLARLGTALRDAVVEVVGSQGSMVDITTGRAAPSHEPSMDFSCLKLGWRGMHRAKPPSTRQPSLVDRAAGTSAPTFSRTNYPCDTPPASV